MIFLHTFLLILTGLESGKALNVWRRVRHSSIVAGNWLYVDGGRVVFEGKDNAVAVNDTFAINLLQNWTNTTLSSVGTTRPLAALALEFQTLWWDEANGTIYCFGGEKAGLRQRGSVTPQESIWGLNTDGVGSGTWVEYLGSTVNNPFPQNIARPSHGFAGSDGLNGYFFGGYITPASSPSAALPWGANEFAPGLLTFNFASLNLTNDTNVAWLSESNSWPPPGRVMHAPSFGAAGVLLALGGRPGQTEAGGPFNNISIFDLGSKKWYWQAAMGTIPYPRSDFCAVGAQEGENSTFEIFIQGGFVNRGDTAVPISEAADVYILSLPSFQWFKANSPSGGPRAFLTCHSAGNNQMILVGGYDYTYDLDLDHTYPDPWSQQIAVFDMTALLWKDKYESSADPYASPEIVKQFYNHSKSKYPLSWSSSGVQQLFEMSTKTSTNSTQPSQTPLTSSSAARLDRGQITGISVGVVSATILLSGSWCLIARRRRKPTLIKPTCNTPQSEPTNQDVPAVVEMQAREDVDYELPGTAYTYQRELRGDLGGVEIRGDLGVV